MIKIIKTIDRSALVKLRQKLSINEGIVTAGSSALTRKVFGRDLSPLEVVRIIIDEVKKTGDKALTKYAKKLDGYDLSPSTMAVSKSEIEKACNRTDKFFLRALEKAAKNILAYQKAIKYPSVKKLGADGMKIELLLRPMDRVGVYIPGGTALYPSSVLMNVLPAKCAGVPFVGLVTPPNREGKINDGILAAAKICGVDAVYRIGGVQGIAALAFGTASIPKVDKIAGPGNMFVALAKKELYGHVGIDMIAGPSEVMIYADETAKPEYTAMDLMAQAEHYPGSAVLLAKSEKYAQEVIRSLKQMVGGLSRSSKIIEDLAAYSLIVIVKDDADAAEIINQFGPEHLQIMVKNTSAFIRKVRNAGAIFAGPETPVAVGDYFAGPSHTLPTGAAARFCSGVNVNDFIKTTAVMTANKGYIRRFAGMIGAIADREGLTAHRDSVKIRLK